jgi:hypothetical protein
LANQSAVHVQLPMNSQIAHSQRSPNSICWIASNGPREVCLASRSHVQLSSLSSQSWKFRISSYTVSTWAKPLIVIKFLCPAMHGCCLLLRPSLLAGRQLLSGPNGASRGRGVRHKTTSRALKGCSVRHSRADGSMDWSLSKLESLIFQGTAADPVANVTWRLPTCSGSDDECLNGYDGEGMFFCAHNNLSSCSDPFVYIKRPP